MRASRLIFLLLLMPFFALTQKTALDLVGGLESSYRSLSVDEGVPSIVISSRSTEEARLSSRFGFNFNYHLSERIWLKTGLRMAHIGYQRKIEGLVFGSDIDELLGGSGGTNPSGTPNSLKIEYIYQYLEIPLGIRYTAKPQKWQGFIELGVAPHIFQSLTHKWKSEPGSERGRQENTMLDFTKVNWATYAAFGVNYQLSVGFQVFLQPTFRYYWTKTTVDTPVQERLFSGGVELGLRKLL